MRQVQFGLAIFLRLFHDSVDKRVIDGSLFFLLAESIDRSMWIQISTTDFELYSMPETALVFDVPPNLFLKYHLMFSFSRLRNYGELDHWCCRPTSPQQISKLEESSKALPKEGKVVDEWDPRSECAGVQQLDW